MHKPTTDKATFYSFIGAPGSGKGTLAQMCCDKLGFKTFSVGNLCRKHVAEKTGLGKLIEKCLQQGSLIPDEYISSMVLDWVKSNIEAKSPIVLDGYPRTVGQARCFLRFLNNVVKDYEFLIFNLIISKNEIVSRLMNRMICDNRDCQAIYASGTSNECSICGYELVKRFDDDICIVEERLKKYPVYSKKLLNFYDLSQVKVYLLDTIGKNVDEVFESFKYFAI